MIRGFNMHYNKSVITTQGAPSRKENIHVHKTPHTPYQVKLTYNKDRNMPPNFFCAYILMGLQM